MTQTIRQRKALSQKNALINEVATKPSISLEDKILAKEKKKAEEQAALVKKGLANYIRSRIQEIRQFNKQELQKYQKYKPYLIRELGRSPEELDQFERKLLQIEQSTNALIAFV